MKKFANYSVHDCCLESDNYKGEIDIRPLRNNKYNAIVEMEIKDKNINFPLVIYINKDHTVSKIRHFDKEAEERGLGYGECILETKQDSYTGKQSCVQTIKKAISILQKEKIITLKNQQQILKETT